MQLIHTKKIIVSIAIVIGTMQLLSPSFAVASTNIYQEIITSSNSGNQTSSGHSSSLTEAVIEVTSTSIINGEVYTYHYATSTNNSVEHRVVIEDGVPVFTETYAAIDDLPAQPSAQEQATWIINLINLLNYLQHYVANTF